MRLEPTPPVRLEETANVGEQLALFPVARSAEAVQPRRVAGPSRHQGLALRPARQTVPRSQVTSRGRQREAPRHAHSLAARVRVASRNLLRGGVEVAAERRHDPAAITRQHLEPFPADGPVIFCT